jgi:hypothetical protein
LLGCVGNGPNGMVGWRYEMKGCVSDGGKWRVRGCLLGRYRAWFW